MVPNLKKEATLPPKAEAKAKGLKAKKAVLNVSSATKKRSACHPTSRDPRPWNSRGIPNIIKKFQPGEMIMTTMLSSNTESAMKKIEDNKIVVFIMDIKDKRHQIKQAIWILYDIDVIKDNNLTMLDEEKKPFLLDSWLLYSRCCQQGWDHVNWEQMANYKCTIFNHKNDN